jgi:hypothetical protein
MNCRYLVYTCTESIINELIDVYDMTGIYLQTRRHKPIQNVN